MVVALPSCPLCAARDVEEIGLPDLGMKVGHLRNVGQRRKVREESKSRPNKGNGSSGEGRSTQKR